MKNLHRVILLLLIYFLNLQDINACGVSECAHKQYGHRRARLSSPFFIGVPTGKEDTPLNYFNLRSYFKEIEKNALQLRQHLILTGAFSSPPSQIDNFVNASILDALRNNE